MRDFDRLPVELRTWLAAAVLPWRPRSVRIAFDKAVLRIRDKASALRELDDLQARLVARDVCTVWGPDYPHSAARKAR